jgi:hypothetical protein
VAFLLWALTVPTNIERQVLELRQSLYRQWGFSSARALPVCVPLLALAAAGPRDPASLGELPGQGSHPAAPQLVTGRVEAAAGALLWRLQPQGSLAAVASSLEGKLPGSKPLAPPPLPVAEGFLLCFVEGSADPRRLCRSLHPQEGVRFTARELVLLRIAELSRQGGPEGAWWEAVAWEGLLRLPLRRSPG